MQPHSSDSPHALAGLIAGVVLFVAFAAVLVGTSRAKGSTSFPDTTPFPSALEQRVHIVRDATAKLRGLSVAPDITEGFVSRSALQLYTNRAQARRSDTQRARIESSESALRLMHEIGPDDDLARASASLYGDQIAGLYFAEDDRLVVIGKLDIDDFAQEVTLSHEYVHSFQDRAFDLTRLSKLGDDRDDATEYGETADCIAEGDATVASIFYMTTVHGPTWTTALKSSDPPTPETQTKAKVPPALERGFLFNYRECVTFVVNIYSLGGWTAVNGLYTKVPATTEQILHPEKYIRGEASLPMTTPDLSSALGAAWTKDGAYSFGEFDVYNYLLSLTDDAISARFAAAGWGAGRLGIYSSKATDDALVHLAIVWDSPLELSQFREAYRRSIATLGLKETSIASNTAPWLWSGDHEYGYARWDETNRRVDVFLSTSAAAIKLVEAAPAQ